MIEALYARNFVSYVREFDTLDDASAFLEAQGDLGGLYAFGVFVDGRPVRNHGVEIYIAAGRKIVDNQWSEPIGREVAIMTAVYAEAKGGN